MAACLARWILRWTAVVRAGLSGTIGEKLLRGGVDELEMHAPFQMPGGSLFRVGRYDGMILGGGCQYSISLSDTSVLFSVE